MTKHPIKSTCARKKAIVDVDKHKNETQTLVEVVFII